MSMSYRFQLSFSCAFALVVAPLAAHAEPGNQMRMTISAKVQMPGMGTLPVHSHTMETCASARKPDPRQMMQKNTDCTTSNYKQDGDTVSFHMACTKPMPMNGDVRFTLPINGNVHGTMHLTADQDGKQMVFDTTYDGERIGACNYTPPAAGG